MRVTICHQAVASDASPDEADVLDQLRAVQSALVALGANTQVLPCTLDLAKVRGELGSWRPDLVFNLVESIDDRGELIALVPCLLEAMNIPYTGASADALLSTSNKLVARRRLRSAGLPIAPAPEEAPSGSFIIKSVWEHASKGMDADSVVDHGRVAAEVVSRQRRFGGRFFAEGYVDAREFNVTLLDGPDGPEVLPIAEIVFDGHTDGTPRIVDYRAKWHPESVEYGATRRRYLERETEADLTLRLAKAAIASWRTFELAGYARIDLRANTDRLVIIDVNANPCLAPDAGFQAALKQADTSFTEAVDRILRRALLGTTPHRVE